MLGLRCSEWGLLSLVRVASLVTEHGLRGVQASVVVAHGPHCLLACGIFPDQESNPCPPHCRWILIHWTTRKSIKWGESCTDQEVGHPSPPFFYVEILYDGAAHTSSHTCVQWHCTGSSKSTMEEYLYHGNPQMLQARAWHVDFLDLKWYREDINVD